MKRRLTTRIARTVFRATGLRATAATALTWACLCQSLVAVENANITVDANGTVNIPAGQSTAGFTVTGNGSTGLIPIQIGPSATDDASSGVLISSVSEQGRIVPNDGGGTERLWSTASVSRDGTGSLSIATHKAGADIASTLFPNGASLDANVNAAYFPFSEGWVGGSVYTNGSSTFNEFALNGLNASNIQKDALEPGISIVSIPGVVDTRRQGIMLANSAQNNNIFTLATPVTDGTGFVVHTGANNENNATPTGDEDFSFVFLPVGTPNMTLARIHPGNSAHAAEALVSSGDDITFVREAQGRYRLSIDGQSPSSGSLLLTQHGRHDDDQSSSAGNRSSDNIPSFVPDGNDWILLSEDLDDTDPIDGRFEGVTTDFPEGQDPNGHGVYFDLAFVPFTNGPTSPGAVPDILTLTGFSKSRVIGWNSAVTALSNDNAPGGMRIDATSASAGISVSGIGSNRGDYHFYVDGAPLSSNEGVMLSTVSEGLRDNSVVGGLFEYGVSNTTNEFGNEWTISAATADPSNGEHNINVSVAFFGADSGFIAGTKVSADDGTGRVDLAIPGVNSLTDGVLMATPWGNDDNFVTVEPKADGSGWNLDNYDNNTNIEDNTSEFEDGVNYVYLPYETENLVAGRVEEDGTIINSTDPTGFTLTKQSTGEYLLQIVGKTFDDGMLLLNATGPDGSFDNTMAYERSGNDFLILGLDMITSEEAGLGQLVDLEGTSFSFAFVDFVDDLVAPVTLTADFDGDGDVDADDLVQWQSDNGVNGNSDADFDGDTDGADFLAWQRQFASTTGANAATTVPEPSLVTLLVIGAGYGLAFRKRHQ